MPKARHGRPAACGALPRAQAIRGTLVEAGSGAPVVGAAIVLAGLTVASGRRCKVRSGAGEATARVGEEARKALDATAQTTRRGFYRYVILRFERDCDSSGSSTPGDAGC